MVCCSYEPVPLPSARLVVGQSSYPLDKGDGDSPDYPLDRLLDHRLETIYADLIEAFNIVKHFLLNNKLAKLKK